MDAAEENHGWVKEEEDYLRMLADSCQYLARKYRAAYELRKAQQAKFRIPSIIIGSVSGVASFGTTTFPDHIQKFVSIAVGGASILIAILNTIESYMKIGELMGASLQASQNFLKLADDISIELSIPPSLRGTQGILYMRETFTLYQKFVDLAPPIRSVRFVKESRLPLLQGNGTSTDAATTEWASSQRLTMNDDTNTHLVPSSPIRVQRVRSLANNVFKRLTGDRDRDRDASTKGPRVQLEIRDDV